MSSPRLYALPGASPILSQSPQIGADVITSSPYSPVQLVFESRNPLKSGLMSSPPQPSGRLFHLSLGRNPLKSGLMSSPPPPEVEVEEERELCRNPLKSGLMSSPNTRGEFPGALAGVAIPSNRG